MKRSDWASVVRLALNRPEFASAYSRAESVIEGAGELYIEDGVRIVNEVLAPSERHRIAILQVAREAMLACAEWRDTPDEEAHSDEALRRLHTKLVKTINATCGAYFVLGATTGILSFTESMRPPRCREKK